jgi:toxin-antitoxin system PIN domain toxin
MPTKSDGAFLDTNILIYATDSSSDLHAPCRELCSRAAQGDALLFVSPQILSEFVAVVTNPSLVTNTMSPRDAYAQAEAFTKDFDIIVPSKQIFSRVLSLLRETGVSGKRVHDVMHAATMLENGVTRIYTYDTGFRRIPQVTVETP